MAPPFNSLIIFLEKNDVWIYILCALGLLWFGADLARTMGTARRAVFGLERETALRARNRALLIVVLLLATAGSVAYVNLQIVPELPPTLFRPPTPTPDPLSLPVVPAPGTVAAGGEPTPTSPVAAPTVTLPGGTLLETMTPEAGTAEGSTPEPGGPTAAPTIPARVDTCTPRANITEPQNGAQVQGILNVFGTANTADFGYFELEISGPQTNGRWASLLGRQVSQPVAEGFLGGNINLTQWASGSYLVRLTVGDLDGNITNQCAVDIILVNN
jgi:hypothetical protein